MNVIREGQFFEGRLVKGKKRDEFGNIHEGDFVTDKYGRDESLKEGKIIHTDGTIELREIKQGSSKLTG